MDRVVVKDVETGKEVWSVKVEDVEESTSTTPPDQSNRIVHRYGPRTSTKVAKPSTVTPAPTHSPALTHSPGHPLYPDSAPDFDEEPVSAAPSASLQSIKAEDPVLANVIEAQITELVSRPPCPPKLVPKTLPYIHPLSQIQRQFQEEQRRHEQLSEQQRTLLRRMREAGVPEKQGQFLPTDTKPVKVRTDHSTSPSVLVPQNYICQHCGAVNLLIKEPTGGAEGGAPK
jgi:hypothetical protein